LLRLSPLSLSASSSQATSSSPGLFRRATGNAGHVGRDRRYDDLQCQRSHAADVPTGI